MKLKAVMGLGFVKVELFLERKFVLCGLATGTLKLARGLI